MKGLLLKNLYCLGQNVKSLLFIIVIWGLVFLPQKDGGLLLISLSMMVSAMFTFTLSSYDRQVKWDTYALSMPLSSRLRQEYVAAIRGSLRNNLNNISIKEPDGSITDLGKKHGGIKEV